MNREKNLSCEMDDICFRLSCGVGMVMAVHECIEHGDLKSESYSDALFGAYDYLSDLVKEMRNTLDSAYAEGGKEAAV